MRPRSRREYEIAGGEKGGEYCEEGIGFEGEFVVEDVWRRRRWLWWCINVVVRPWIRMGRQQHDDEAVGSAEPLGVFIVELPLATVRHRKAERRPARGDMQEKTPGRVMYRE